MLSATSAWLRLTAPARSLLRREAPARDAPFSARDVERPLAGLAPREHSAPPHIY